MGTRLPTDPPPFFEAHVFVCCNRRPDGHQRGSCAAKGAERLRDYMKARAKELGIKGVRVNSAGWATCAAAPGSTARMSARSG